MALTDQPAYDLVIGPLKFGREHLLHFVDQVTVNRSIDKGISKVSPGHLVRGKGSKGLRKNKMNHATIVIACPSDVLLHIKRAGDKIVLKGGYPGAMLRWGTFLIDRRSRERGESSEHKITINALSSEILLARNWEPANHRGLTYTEIARRYCKNHGLDPSFIGKTNVKVDTQKSAFESDLNYLERLAADIGWDCYVLDDIGKKGALFFGSPYERTVLSIGGGGPMTFGHGFASGAMFCARVLRVDDKVSRSSASVSAVNQKGTLTANFVPGQGFGVGTGGALVTIKDDITTKKPESRALPLGTTPNSATAKQKANAATRGSNEQNHSVTASFAPGIPFLTPSMTMRLIGEGDDNGLYKTVDVTQQWGKITDTEIKTVRSSGNKKKPNAGKTPGDMLALYKKGATPSDDVGTRVSGSLKPEKPVNIKVEN